MASTVNVELPKGEGTLDHASVSSSVSRSTPSVVSDDNYVSSSNNNESSTNPSGRLPSFYNLQGSTGLQPTRNAFDCAVIRRLDNVFDESALELLEEERLKTFLRIRPSSVVGVEPKATKSKVAKKEVLEIKDGTTVVTFPIQKTVNSFPARGRVEAERNKATEFKFTKVLGPESSQADVFEECVNPLIEKFLRNENCLIFGYGATNSGKTYTLQGHGTDYGIIPRTLEAIFNRIQDRVFKQSEIRPHLYQSFHHLSTGEVKKLQDKKEAILLEAAHVKNELMQMKENMSFADSQSSSQGSTVHLVGAAEFSEMNYALFSNMTMYSVWVSFAELYNEKVYDLLETIHVGKNKRRKERKLLQDNNGFVYIKDLTELHATSDDEAYKIFLAGRKNLQFAATQMNLRSSRSHSFFTIRVVSIGIGEPCMPFPKTVHRMTFCDLAGMERAAQTENEGARLKESSSINTSLTVLLKVIRLLREKQARGNRAIETIPFRESKLTHIFKSYFTSSTHICMIVNVNPDPRMADSTLQVLHNSAIASNVIAFRPIEVELKQQRLPQDTRQLPQDRSKKLVANGKENKDPAKVLQPKTRRLKTAFDSSSDTDEYGNNAVPYTDFSSSESDNENKGQTVVSSHKLLQLRVIALEEEVQRLKKKLVECELEKQRIREESVKMLNEQNRFWIERNNEYRNTQDNICRRKLSLMMYPSAGLSPGSKCGRIYTPPKVYMDNIGEGEEVDSVTSEDENA